MVYNEDKPKSFFLMTTALEEFWDTSKPSIFLGEWCRRYGRKLFWEKLDAEVIKSPWADDLTLELATGYVNDKYEWLLAALSGALNRLHKTCHNERYWRILLGPWLLMYVPVMYDRSMYIKAALAAHPDLSTIVLSEDSYVIPQDTFDFFHLASNDHYNLQIYSRIFKSLGKDFPSQKERIITPDILLPRPSLLIGLMMSIKPVLNSFTKIFRNRASVLFRESYFPLSVEMQIILKSKSRIFPFLAKKNNKIVDSSLRLDLSLTAEASDTFEELLYKQVIMDIPRCYVEGYKQFSDFAFNSNSNITKAVLSSISWYYDESFKFFAASSSEKGIALLGIQHGGNYGSIFTHPGEKHEISITDRYYSW
ncbi:MAG: LIC12162 family protein, partial [Desulfuromonadales bacterium]